jgi:hypothetical protein
LGFWVAAGDAGKLFTAPSSDGGGVTWTTRTSNFGTKNIFDVQFGNGKFIAIGAQGTMTVSTAVTNWTPVTGQPPNNASYTLDCLVYSNGVWIMAGDNGISTLIWTSADNGVTWTARTVPSPLGDSADSQLHLPYAIDAMNGVVVVAVTYGKFLVSNDNGTTWNIVDLGIGNVIITAVKALNGILFAGTTTGRIFTSTNGTTWNEVATTIPSTSNINDFSYAKGVYILVTSDGTTWTSIDGTTWSRVLGFPIVTPLRSLVTDGKYFIAAGDQGGMAHAAATLSPGYNSNGATVVGYNFKKKANFFDIVQFTSNGSSARIPHSLGVIPGMIAVKNLSTGDWMIWTCGNVGPSASHTGLSFNSTNASSYMDGFSDVTSVDFTTGSITNATANASASGAGSYVAYLWANDPSATSIIKCGEFTTSGGIARVELGFEPQFILMKALNITGSWLVLDSVRGINNLASGADQRLVLGDTTAETATSQISTDSNGFSGEGLSSASRYIYMAIRKPIAPKPTNGLQVFAQSSFTGTAGATAMTYPGWSPDMVWGKNVSGATAFAFYNRQRGFNNAPFMTPSATSAAIADSTGLTTAAAPDGYTAGGGRLNPSATDINYAFKRAVGFFDIVTFNGDSAGDRSLAHQLGAKPELVMLKAMTAAGEWYVTSSTYVPEQTAYSTLSSSAAMVSSGAPNVVDADANYVFTHQGGGAPYLNNTLNVKYEVMLFGSVPGVSKVGVYYGNGSTVGKNIECGFANGARFVMIKRLDASGSWLVFDTARGIVSGASNVALQLNTTGSINSANTINPYSPGFSVKVGASPETNAFNGTWVNATAQPANGDLQRAAFSPISGAIVAGTSTGKLVYSLNKGVNWSAVASNPFSAASITGIAFGNSKFIAINSNGDVGASTSGTNGWALTGANLGAGLLRLRYMNGQFVAVFAGVIKTSTDGVTWASTAMPSANGIGSSPSANGTAIVTTATAGIYRSTNNMASFSSLTPIANWNGFSVVEVAGGNSGRWVALFAGGQISTSADDGLTWTVPSGVGNGSRGINFVNQTFWVYGLIGGIAYTFDGSALTGVTNPTGQSSMDIICDDVLGGLVVVCAGGVAGVAPLARYLFLAIA